jgi:hypothetical protein
MNQNTLDVRLQQHFKQLIHRYVRAKDQNKPHLLQQVFCEDAVLNMQVESENISFPAHTFGLAAIRLLLVRNFSQRYENIYTYCIEDSITIEANRLSCLWLVIMTDRATGQLNVGTGDYVWTFSGFSGELDEPNKVQKLQIVIHQMLVLSASRELEVLQITETLAYPWCRRADLQVQINKIGLLNSISEALNG